jgi:two-component system NtrC family sensor kinase
MYASGERLPPHELYRISNLKSYEILDTHPEKEFDQIVQLAAAVTGAPIAAISLVDQNRLWFKAKLGFELTEVPRAGSFCEQAILKDQSFIVEDSLADSQFGEHMFIAQAGIRFYAGIPIRTEEGYALGALCVLDKQPRKLSSEQIEMLKSLASQVTALLERNRYRKDLEIYKSKLYESAKISALGQMAASIVHEIKNPLSVLQLRASVLSAAAKQGKDTHETVENAAENMLEVTRRIGKIIGSLSLAFGNTEHEIFKEVSVTELINETLSFSKSRFMSDNIEIEYKPLARDSCFWGKPIQISQVLLNLLNNAHHAAVTSTARKRWVRIEIKDEEHVVELSIIDCGKPMSQEIAQKVFAPFFTTKPLGLGTGLGLSISADIIKSHGGELRHDPLTKNTRFVLRIPKQPNIPKPVLNH